MAAIFLREPITWQRTALIFIGFIGVLIVVQPGSDASPALLWAVAAGTFYGAFLTSSRWLSHLGSPIALSFTQLFIAALILTPFGLITLPTFTPYVVSITFLSGLGSMLGNLLLLYAYSAAPCYTAWRRLYIFNCSQPCCLDGLFSTHGPKCGHGSDCSLSWPRASLQRDCGPDHLPLSRIAVEDCATIGTFTKHHAGPSRCVKRWEARPAIR